MKTEQYKEKLNKMNWQELRKEAEKQNTISRSKDKAVVILIVAIMLMLAVFAVILNIPS